MNTSNTISKSSIPGVKNIILVASGKGGVGKSTVAAGIALSLAKEGFSTGLLDTDLYGPSLPLLFDIEGSQPTVEMYNGKSMMVPLERFGIKLMSIGFFVSTNQAVIWRGPRASSGTSQLLSETHWGHLDYLIIDTPPGTGDIHITLLQNFNIAGVIMVTTPQNLSLSDVKKAIHMYRDPNIGIHVMGIVENMSWFTPLAHPDEQYYLFGKGGGKLLSEEFQIPLIAQIPINENMCLSCDKVKINELLNDNAIQAAFFSLVKPITSLAYEHH